jgi:2-polyprenyl-3-methyl-5-hydroxy-6-metoxy-1,4-benzoquinol methylase
VKYRGKILNIGAGNSVLSEEMYKEGYKHITNVDFSEIVVDDMQSKYKKEGYDPTLSCKPSTTVDELADVRNMRDIFPDETFDCVIDKGMLDSVLVHLANPVRHLLQAELTEDPERGVPGAQDEGLLHLHLLR